MTDYPTNLSNGQWQIISKHLDTQRSRKYSLHDIMNAVLYLVKTGIQWRMMPNDFPQWQIVYYYFTKWKKDGTWDLIHESLVERIRKKEGRNEEPTAAIIDAQSVKSTLVSAENKGFDAGKRIKGIKRHIIADTLGLVLAVVVQSADMQDRDGATAVFEKLVESWRKITKVFADGGYRGKLIKSIKEKFAISLEIVKRDELHIFKVLPKRWIVERTFAWIDTNRRTSKNYERLNSTSVAIVQIAAIRIMANRF
jgi:putative transposase